MGMGIGMGIGMEMVTYPDVVCINMNILDELDENGCGVNKHMRDVGAALKQIHTTPKQHTELGDITRCIRCLHMF